MSKEVSAMFLSPAVKHHYVVDSQRILGNKTVGSRPDECNTESSDMIFMTLRRGMNPDMVKMPLSA